MPNITLCRVRATVVAMESKNYYIFRECVFASFGIQLQMRISRIVICGLSAYSTFFHIIS
jgi:hypothetical protein